MDAYAYPNTNYINYIVNNINEMALLYYYNIHPICHPKSNLHV